MSSEKKPQRKFGCLIFLGKLVYWVCFLIFLVILAGCVAGYVVVNHYAKGLPDVSKLRQYDPAETTSVYSSDGQVIATLFKENRTWVPLEKISPNMRKAILAIEDSRFYEHHGVDPIGVARAALDLYRSGGEIRQGASTITMQLARAFFLNADQNFHRKIREALLALQIEKNFSKDEILELYLNQVYFGAGAYGVHAAANIYFGTSADKLSVVQAAVIAGLPASPSYYSPLVNESAASKRALEVLGRMRQLDEITQAQYRQAVAQLTKGLKYANKGRKEFQILKVPYFTAYVLKELTSRYSEDLLYRGGLKIYTTVDLKLQQKTEQIIKQAIVKNKEWYNASNAASVVLIFQDSMYADVVGEVDAYGNSEGLQILRQYIPNAVYVQADTDSYNAAISTTGGTCSLHTPTWMQQNSWDSSLTTARQNAQTLITQVNQYLSQVQTLPDSDRNTLLQQINTLQSQISYGTASNILRTVEELQYTYNALREAYPPVGAY